MKAFVLVLLAELFAVATVQAQVPPQLPPAADTRDEAFEKVDPYTKGGSAAMDRAGYVSFGPFLFAEGVKTQDIEEAIGTSTVIWIETAHFKLGSTLKTYKLRGDQKEAKRLREEFGRLEKRFDKFAPPRGKLDPWLRAHLFAQRLEELYTWFEQRFHLSDDEFDPTRRPKDSTTRTTGAYLGMPHKFTVLLLEKESSLVRFAKRFLDQEPKGYVRWRLGGSMALAISADGVRGYGYELESAFTCMVLAEETHNLLDGYRDAWTACPMWFKYGLAHVVSRDIDERWTISALGTTREFGDDSWKWQPRVGRLLANGFVKGFEDLFGWTKWDEIKPQGHMLAWSRVEWLLDRKGCDRRVLLDELCVPLLNLPESERARHFAERSRAALQKATGAGLEALDLEWREYVAKNYAK